MKNKINECKTLEELTILWQSKYPNKVFVKDGIVNPNKWVTQEIKPMFLLKEAYGGKESWDLINDHILVKSKKQVDKTWKSHAHTHDRKECDTFYFMKCTISGNRKCTKCVNAGLHNHVANAVHGVLNSARKTLTDDLDHRTFIELKVG